MKPEIEALLTKLRGPEAAARIRNLNRTELKKKEKELKTELARLHAVKTELARLHAVKTELARLHAEREALQKEVENLEGLLAIAEGFRDQDHRMEGIE